VTVDLFIGDLWGEEMYLTTVALQKRKHTTAQHSANQDIGIHDERFNPVYDGIGTHALPHPH
jgi:hypothetical protein